MSVEAFAAPSFILEFFCLAIDIRQLIAIGKGLPVDGGHAIGNGDGGQAAAAREYIKY